MLSYLISPSYRPNLCSAKQLLCFSGLQGVTDSEPEPDAGYTEERLSGGPKPKKPKHAIVRPSSLLKGCRCSKNSPSCTEWFMSDGLQKYEIWKSNWKSLHKLDQDHTVVTVRGRNGCLRPNQDASASWFRRRSKQQSATYEYEPLPKPTRPLIEPHQTWHYKQAL